MEGVVKKLEEENEGLLITTWRVELREAAMEAFPGKDFSRRSWEKLTKEELGLDFVRPRKITRYDPLTYSNMYAEDMVKWATAEACLAYEAGSKLL